MSNKFTPIDETCEKKSMNEACTECPSILECYETNE